MSEQFRQGQLVAVRDSNASDWQIRVYDHERGGQHFCLDPEHELSQAMWWAQVCPAEFIWPNVYLACDREIIDSLRQELDKERQITEQNICAVELEQELVQRLRKQTRWLCQELNQINSGSDEMCHCPDSELRFAPKPIDCHPEGCANCWEQASLKAVKEKPCP